MIVEMREYTLQAGKVPEYLRLYEREGLATHSHRFRITNADRAIGAHVTGEVLRRGISLAEPMEFEFVGTAGQSFGAFLTSGVSLRLLGEANDYVGKSLCGGSLAISAGAEASDSQGGVKRPLVLLGE